jgi:hypothetical protein
VRGAVIWLALVAFAAPASAAVSKKPAIAKKAKPAKKKKKPAPAAASAPDPGPAHATPEPVPAVEPPVLLPDSEPEPEAPAAPPPASSAAPDVVTPPPTERMPSQATPPGSYDKRTIAALGVFVTAPGESLDAAALGDTLRASLEGTDMLLVVGPTELAPTLSLERQAPLLSCLEGTCVSNLVQAVGTDFVFTAGIGHEGPRYVVTTRMIDSAKQRVIARSTVAVEETGQLLEAVWRATQQTLDSYGSSLPTADAVRWATRPRPEPPASLTASSGPVSQLGAWALLVGGYQPLSIAGKRASAGGDVSLNFRRGRFDVAAGVVIAASPGARVALGLAVVDSTFRLDLLLRGTAFPGVGWYGGGLAAQLEWVLTPHFGVVANLAGEAYPGQGSVIVALLGGFGMAARF